MNFNSKKPSDYEDWEKYRVKPKRPSNYEDWEKYRVKPKKNSEDSWPALIGKSALKGVTSIADIPKLAATLGETVLNSSLKSPPRYADKDLFIFDDEINKTPQFEFSKYVPSTEAGRKSLKKVTGIDLEPKSNS